MTFRNAASATLLLALISIGVYWLFTRPTPEEKALTDFFGEFRKGHYEEAEDYVLGDDFYKMAADTSVRDTDNTEYLIGDYFPENRKSILRASIETYVRLHISRWKYLYMETSRFEDYSVVKFRIEFAIRDLANGNIMGVSHEARLEGNAYMELEDDNWAVRNFELSVFSDENLALASYLERAQ